MCEEFSPIFVFPAGYRFHDYTLLGEIGHGTFSHVYKATQKGSNQIVAIKIVPKRKGIMTQLNKEIDILRAIDHPFIVHLYGVIEEPLYIAIIEEFVEGVPLTKLIDISYTIAERQLKVIFAQLLVTLEYLHNTVHITHRDIKTENIMVDKNSTIRLLDFGLSEFFDPENPILSDGVGTTPYLPPEMVNYKNYTPEVDIWSTGCLMYAITYGHLPFDGNDPAKIYKSIKYMTPNFQSEQVAIELQDLLKCMLEKDERNRITIDKLMDHSFFHSITHTMKEKLVNYQLPDYLNLTQELKIVEVTALHYRMRGFFSQFQEQLPETEPKFIPLIYPKSICHSAENALTGSTSKEYRKKAFSRKKSTVNLLRNTIKAKNAFVTTATFASPLSNA